MEYLRSYSSKGFSLSDILVALIILSSALLASVPSISEIKSYREVKSSATKIAHFIENLSIEASANEIAISIAPGPKLIAQTVLEQRVLSLNKNISLRFGSQSQTSIKLYSSEVARPGTIIIESNGGSLCAVVLSLRNRTRILC